MANKIAIEAGADAGLSLLFARGTRPTVAEVGTRASQDAFDGFSVSHWSPEGEGTLELLAGGLTFGLAGLAPALPAPAPPRRHVFGLEGPELPDDLEAVHLAPAAHLAGGAALLPVVRTMTEIAAELAGFEGVRAVCWHPAGLWTETALFVRMTRAWLAEGAFPALGLTVLRRDAEGGVRSSGLAFFVGQELWLAPGCDEAPADTVGLAVRLIRYLVGGGAIDPATDLTAPDGARLEAEPLPDGVLRIRRRS